MHHEQREAEATRTLLAMNDGDAPGRQAIRDTEPQRSAAPEVLGAAEHERALLDGQGERHADAPAHALLEAGRAGKTLGRPDHLRERAFLVVDAGPALRSAR